MKFSVIHIRNSLIKIFNKISSIISKNKNISRHLLRIFLTVLFILALIFFPLVIWEYKKETNSLRNIMLILSFITGFYLILFPISRLGILFNECNMKSSMHQEQSIIQQHIRDWWIILGGAISLIIVVCWGGHIFNLFADIYKNGDRYFLDFTQERIKNEEVILSILFMLLLGIIMLMRYFWWVSVSSMGFMVALFITITPQLFTDPSNIIDWLDRKWPLIITVAIVSAIVLPVMVFGTNKVRHEQSKIVERINWDICQKAAMKSLIVPGLVVTFISSAGISLGGKTTTNQFVNITHYNITRTLESFNEQQNL